MASNTSNHKDEYLLSRGGLASARLTAQYFIITERQGWLLHPDIEKSIAGRTDLKIAHVATGNGIWALSLAKLYPSADIVGLDISSEQFPPAFTLPPNVSLDYCNVLEPIPSKFKNVFDVIHIRLTVAAISGQDKDTLIDNILGLLMPGATFSGMKSVTMLPRWWTSFYKSTDAVDHS